MSERTRNPKAKKQIESKTERMTRNPPKTVRTERKLDQRLKNATFPKSLHNGKKNTHKTIIIGALGINHKRILFP